MNEFHRLRRNIPNNQEQVIQDGYWVHKNTGVKTYFGLNDPSITGTTMNTPSWKNDASEIKVPEGITVLGASSLRDTPDLKKLILPPTLQTIGNNAMDYTTGLLHLHVYSEVPPVFGDIGGYVGKLPEVQVRVPANAYDNYISSFWYNFLNYIYILNDLIPGSRVHSGYTLQTENIAIGQQTSVVIEGLHFDNPTNVTGGNTALIVWGSNYVLIRNCKFTNIPIMEAIGLLECSNVIICNCDFESVHAGIRVSACTESVRIFSNDFKNILGHSQGGDQPGQAVQLRNNPNATGQWTIQDNAIENIQDESAPEDNINIFFSNFESGTPLRIRNNWIRGGGPSQSGGGIIIGDNGDGFLGGNQVVEDNILVNPGQYGVAIAGGSNMILQRNLVYSEQKPWSNVGIVGVNWDGTTQSENITIRENRVNWTNRDGVLNPAWIYENVEPVIGIDTNVLYDTTVTPALLSAQIIGV